MRLLKQLCVYFVWRHGLNKYIRILVEVKVISQITNRQRLNATESWKLKAMHEPELYIGFR